MDKIILIEKENGVVVSGAEFTNLEDVFSYIESKFRYKKMSCRCIKDNMTITIYSDRVREFNIIGKGVENALPVFINMN